MKYSKLLLFALLALILRSQKVAAQSCDCMDETPPGGTSCEEHESRGSCNRFWMRRGRYCSLTCGFCQCDNEDVGPSCASCDDISPDGMYSCAQQRSFGKCDDPWMKPFCRETCGRCDCGRDEFKRVNAAFVGVREASGLQKPRARKPLRSVDTPLTETLPDYDGNCTTTVLDVLADAPQFTLLVEIVKATELSSYLADKNLSVTIFAPVNDAFDDLAEEFGMKLDAFVREHPAKVKELLQYHIVPRAIPDNKEIGDSYSFRTLVPGKDLYGSSEVEIDGIGSSATVIQDGVKICKSVVYTIDEVLLPGTTIDDIGPKVPKVPVPQDEEPDCDPNSDIMTALAQETDLSLFVKGLEAAKIISLLQNEDKGFTIFAPTNEAIERTLLEAGLTFKELLRDRKRLESVLNYHIVNKDFDSESLKSGKLKTLEGDSILLAVESSGIEIAGVGSSALVIDSDVDDVCTSSIYKLDSLLLPFDVSGKVWAVDGIEEKTIKEEEIKCNSIAHVLTRNSNLRVLNNAAQAAGLMPLLADKSQKITLFAPTDMAFYATFLDPENQTFPPILTDPDSLLSIISYHTVQNALPFSRLRTGSELKTELGTKKEGDLQLSVVKKRLSPTGKILRGVNGDAAIVQKNIVACDSVIHLIDAVLLPFNLKNDTQPIRKGAYYSRLAAKT